MMRCFLEGRDSISTWVMFGFQAIEGQPEPVYIVDEIGKMELMSSNFQGIVKDVFQRPNSTVLCTIPVGKGRPIQLIEDIKSGATSKVFYVSILSILKFAETSGVFNNEISASIGPLPIVHTPQFYVCKSMKDTFKARFLQCGQCC
jgi:hypothetical protein